MNSPRHFAPFFACLVLVVGLNGSSALAHPHVWVTGASKLYFENDLLTKVGMRWQFDAFFSQVLTGDFDTNKDGQFDTDETEAMKAQVFTSLRDYGYFTHLRVNGTETIFDRVEKFSTTVDKGELVFIFDLILPEPLDLRSTKTQLSLYDPSIYVDIVLGGEKPLVMQGIDAGKCNWSFASGEDIANENGMLTQQVVKLSCG